MEIADIVLLKKEEHIYAPLFFIFIYLNIKMKRTLIIFFLLGVVKSFAQEGFLSYIDGAPVTLIKKTDVNGSEFLYEKWLPATVKNSKGKEYKDIKIKYNLLEDIPYFLSKSDGAMSFSTPLIEFSINKENGEQQKFKSGFPSIDKFNEMTFYEVLVDGNAKLLKKVSKKITESRAYNSATTVKSIVDNTAYFIFEDGKISTIKKDKKSLVSVLIKKQVIHNCLSESGISIKREEDLLKVIEKYNSF